LEETYIIIIFFYVTLHNIKQTRCLHFTIHLQNKQKLKCKGIQNTKTLNDYTLKLNQDTILLPHAWTKHCPQ